MWVYNNEPIDTVPELAIGFVYCITNTENNKKYIGKKLFHSVKIVQRNKKKKRLKVESNWKDYFGSNETLKNLVLEIGIDNFHREILYICFSKSECSYLEATEQFSRNVLLSDDYYNDWISVKITRKHIKRYSDKLKSID
jgi:hypothetical protein